MSVDLLDVTAYLHEHIPLSAQLGARASAYDGRSLRLEAPLLPNLNHQQTAFGGSLSALAILSGWALVHLKLREASVTGDLVIQRSTIDYLEPIQGDFAAVAVLPVDKDWEKFLRTVERRGRGRVTVLSSLYGPSGKAGEHEGVYVAARAR